MDKHGLKIVVDSRIPEGEIHVQDRSGLTWDTLGKIVNIGISPEEALLYKAYCELLSELAPKKSIMEIPFD